MISAAKEAYGRLAASGTNGAERDGSSAADEGNATSPATTDVLCLVGELLGGGEPPYEPSGHHLLQDLTAGRCLTHFPHCSQRDTWDCGVACMTMIMRWLRPSQFAQQIDDCLPLSCDELAERKWIIDACESQSIWTIDFIIILQRLLDDDLRQSFDFPLSSRNHDDDDAWDRYRYLYLSKRFGVDEAYKSYGYYKDAFERDAARVKKRFVLARELNLPMCEARIGLDLLVDLIAKDECIAMVLIDNAVLKRSGGDYAGHYVLLVGISTDTEDIAQAEAYCGKEEDPPSTPYCLVVKNPNWPESITFVTPTLFEKAWRANGTDEDVILIAKAM